jgi:hypothetical protein
MKSRPSKRPLPGISSKARKKIEGALDELGDIGWIFSEAETASDNLAGALRDAFFFREKSRFAGKTPNLYEVIGELDEEFDLPSDAVDSAAELESLIEDSYRDDDDDDILDDIRDWASTLIGAIREFLKLIPS